MKTTMMTTMKKIPISFLFLFGFYLTGFSQEQPLKDYAEEHTEMKLCFYPSTLRMINLSHNKAFDEMVGGIDKLLVYTLDSVAKAGRGYTRIIEKYQGLGYDELAAVYGGGFDIFIYGNDRRKENEYVGIIKQDDKLTAFYMRGSLDFSKIPGMIQTLKNGDVINPFDFNLTDFGKHTQDQ